MKICVFPGNRTMKHHVADVELVDETLGFRVVGMAVWRRRDGKPGLSVTWPSRKSEEGTFFHYVRSVDREEKLPAKLRTAIFAQLKGQYPSLRKEIEAGEAANAKGGAQAS